MSIRSRAREKALKALYQNDLTGEPVEEVLAAFQEDGDEPEALREFFVAIALSTSAWPVLATTFPGCSFMTASYALSASGSSTP